jgi:hypothetical protein
MSAEPKVFVPDRGIKLPDGARPVIPVAATAALNLDGQPTGLKGGAPPFDTEEGAKKFIFGKLGDLKDVRFLFNEVLVAKYIRQKVSENLVASADTQQMDRWQGVIGMVLKIGPTAYQDDEGTKFPWDLWLKAGLVREKGECPIKPGDWVLYRHSDGWDKGVRAMHDYGVFECRALQDAHIRGIVDYPGRWF